MGSRRRVAAACVAAVCAALVACEPAPPPPWTSEVVSVTAGGLGSGSADTPTVSPDGTKVAFRSYKSDLGPTDTNGVEDLYVRDLVTGVTTLVSANAAGTDSGNGRVTSGAVFDPSGTKVAFTSEATDLVPQAPGYPQNVFVRDLTTGTTTLVSVDEAGTGSGDAWSGNPVFSPDGTKVAFTSSAHNLVPGVESYYSQAYLRDLVAGTTTLLSRDNEGNVGYHAADAPAFLPDGTGVFLVTASWLLGPLHPTAGTNIYLRDLATGTNVLVSETPGGGAGYGDSGNPVPSPDGTKVAFTSTGNEFGPTDTNGDTDVYLRDLATGDVTLVTANAAGTDSANGRSGDTVFSPDGGSIAFVSFASDLGPTDTHSSQDVYVRDLATGEVTLVSANAAGTDSAAGSSGSWNGLRFDATGNLLAFVSEADDLGPTDTNRTTDVYVRDLGRGATSLVSANAEGTDSGNLDSGYIDGFAFTPAGGVVFVTRATDLHPDLTEERTNVMLATAPDAANVTVAVTATPDPVDSGAPLTYVVSARNAGPEAAEAAVLAVALPVGVTPTAVSASTGTCEIAAQPGVVSCRLGSLAVDARVEVTVEATVTAAPGATLVAHAALTSDTWNPDGAPVVARATTAVAGG